MQTSKRIHIPTDENYISHLNELMPPADYGFNIDFSNYRQLFDELNLDCPLDYLQTMSDRKERAVATQAIYTAAWKQIHDNPRTKEQLRPLLVSLWAYLSKVDPLQKSDLIFVAGGKIAWQRGRAILELFNRGLAEEIVITGDKPFLDKDHKPAEAGAIRAYLLKRGVEPSQLTIEGKARNTTENVYLSYQLLKAKGDLPKSLIVVSNPMQALRLYLTFKAIGPKLGWEPTICRKTIRLWVGRRSYFNDFDEFCILLSEYTKLYYSFCQSVA